MRNLLLAFLLCLSAPALAQQDPTAENADIQFGGPDSLIIETGEASHAFTVELALTPEQQQRGLMWREALAPDSGMLFHYAPARPTSMWMENTRIALDILYIGADGQVVKLIANAQPESHRSLNSDFPVAGVLELAGGRALELGIRPGATVRHAIFNNVLPSEVEAEPEVEAAAETEETAAEEPAPTE